MANPTVFDMATPTLSLQSLHFGHSGQALLPAPFSGNFGPGLHFLLGRNGAGKSTLLRTIGGLQTPLSGHCLLDDQRLSHMPPPQRALRVSLATTTRLTTRYLTVAALLRLGRAPYTDHWGRLSKADEDTIAHYVSVLGLAHLLQRDMQELSDGERQQVWVARALVQDTPLVLLDEPTHHLDVVNRLQLLQQLAHIAVQHHKIIWVATHEIETAMRMGESFLVLQKGESLVQATRATLQERNLIEAAFGAPGLRFDYLQNRFEWENKG